MADYATLADVKLYLNKQDAASDSLLTEMVTRYSRLFDRETGRPTNFWSPQTGVTRRYSGNGTQWLDIDEYDLITAVTMSTNQSRSDAITLVVTPPSSDNDPNWPNFVEIYPLTGPPFTQLFLLRSWLPDAWHVGNVAVTGNVSTPDDITHAVTLWVAHQFVRMRANWADRASISGGPTLQWSAARPDEVQRVIDYYTDAHRGPKVGLVAGNEDALGERISPWLSWRTSS